MEQTKQVTFQKYIYNEFVIVNSNRCFFNVIYITIFLDSKFIRLYENHGPFFFFFYISKPFTPFLIYIHYDKASLDYKPTPTQTNREYLVCGIPWSSFLGIWRSVGWFVNLKLKKSHKTFSLSPLKKKSNCNWAWIIYFKIDIWYSKSSITTNWSVNVIFSNTKKIIRWTLFRW